MPVLPIAEHAQVEYDLIIVATLERSDSSRPIVSAPAWPARSCFRCAGRPRRGAARIGGRRSANGKAGAADCCRAAKRKFKSKWPQVVFHGTDE
jgi:hypothetical protein